LRHDEIRATIKSAYQASPAPMQGKPNPQYNHLANLS